MKKRICLVSLFMVLMGGCRATGIAPIFTPSPVLVPTQLASTQPSATTDTLPPLPPIAIDWTKPFGGKLDTGDSLTLSTWVPQPYTGKTISLPFRLEQMANVHVLDGLTAAQKTFLAQNGFVVIHSQEAQFGDIRVETAQQTGQPYYLTTDAAFHALHLLFDDMLKAIEREYFRPQMLAITQAALQEVRADLPSVRGTSIEAETRQALAYLSVALKLFDPTASIDPSVADPVSRQVDQIAAAGGRGRSVIFPDFVDDYGAYKPVGHYAGDPDLEAYFRGMTWFGRMHFRLQDPENPDFAPSRLPLIVTLALRRAQIENQPASDVWASTHETLTFVIGPSDDAGPLEYAALMDSVYGNTPTLQDLADDGRWREFLSRSNQLPAPQINSLFVRSTIDLASEKGWRFMGQRFTLDGLIFQNVIFDRVREQADGTRRELPSGLDVMAAFGSSPALTELGKQGVTSFPNYSDQMTKMQQAVLAQPEAQWLGRFYDGWLYSFLPVVQPKDASYPPHMRTSAWGYKDLNTALGSWSELKHDTILYTKMPEMAGGGGPPMSGPAPSYVEPNPVVFYRMAYMAQMLSCGLQDRVLYQPCSLDNFGFRPEGASGYVSGMFALGDRFKTLGNIAAKELAGQPLSEEDNDAITDCLGMIECVNLATDYNRPQSEMPKVPIIAAVSGAKKRVLEVGVGNVDRIYVAVPLEGQWQVAQGGVFSYYEFAQPRDQRLTDDEWRAKLAGNEVALPAWAANFVLTGGQPKEWLAFRKGDIYMINEAGNNLNVRDSASLKGAVATTLKTGEYVEIIDGPVVADGYIWWNIKWLNYSSEPTGWAIENQQWYVRSYLP